LKSERQRVSNGTVAPGEGTCITTTLGHRFAIVGQENDFGAAVTSEVPVQVFRFDPPDKGGVPAIYTQRVSGGGFPTVASAKVNPYALKEAVYLVDLTKPGQAPSRARNSLPSGKKTGASPGLVRSSKVRPARWHPAAVAGKDGSTPGCGGRCR
jgi:hypothetical protein